MKNTILEKLILNNKALPTEPVGGEIVPINKLSLLLSQYWLLIILLLVPFALLLYMKSGMAMKLFSPLVSRFFKLKLI